MECWPLWLISSIVICQFFASQKCLCLAQLNLSVGVPRMTLASEILTIQKMHTQTHWTSVNMISNAFDDDYDHDGNHNNYELNVNIT